MTPKSTRRSKPTRAARQRQRLASLRQLSRFERSLARRLRALLASQATAIAGSLRTVGHFTESVVSQGRSDRVALLSEFYRNVALTFGNQLIRSAGRKASLIGFSFEEAVRIWVHSRALAAIEDMDRVTLRAVRRIIDDAVQDGSRSINDLAKTITAELGTGAVARSETIARTEMHAAMNYGQVEAAASSGLKLVKTWTASLDDRTRQGHIDADGQTVPLDEPFSVGGELVMHPGEGSADNAINCRCVCTFSETSD